jgi:hypothetical protein
MAKKQPRLTKREKKALDPGAGPRVISRHGSTYHASGNVSEEALEAAESYFADKEKHGGPAQQMMDFVEPLMEKARASGNLEVTNRVMSLGMMFWNMALLSDDDRAEALQKAQETVCKTEADRETLRQTASMMIARHEKMFPWLHDGRGR